MSKFAHCHESNGLMWCQHPNGNWAPPFPATRDAKDSVTTEQTVVKISKKKKPKKKS